MEYEDIVVIAVIFFLLKVLIASLLAGWAAATLYEVFTGKSIAHGILDYLRIGFAIVILAMLFRPSCTCNDRGEQTL